MPASAPPSEKPIPLTGLSTPALASANAAVPPATVTESPASTPESERPEMVAVAVPSYTLFATVKATSTVAGVIVPVESIVVESRT